MGSWRQSTSEQYSTYITKWQEYCTEKQINPISASPTDIINFLAEQCERGIGYSAVNTAKCAIASVTSLATDKSIGQHPLVKRFMKGIFEKRPSLPRYTSTWDMDILLNHVKDFNLSEMTLKHLTIKLATLLAICTGQRLQTLQSLTVSNIHFQQDSFTCVIKSVLKTTRPGKHIKPIVFKKHSTLGLCVLSHLEKLSISGIHRYYVKTIAVAAVVSY